MGDCESIMPINDGEEHVIAAAQHLLKALAASKNVSSDIKKILADLGTHLSTMDRLTEADTGGTDEVEDRLKCAQNTVMSWQSNQVMIWDSGPREASEYLRAVDEVRRLTENLAGLLSSGNGRQKELLDRAHNVLQMAMARLEEELIHILKNSKQFVQRDAVSVRSYEVTSFRRETVSVHSCQEDVVYDESLVSSEDSSIEDTSRMGSCGNESVEYVLDLVHPDVISDIKSIANVMFASNYGQEFCQAFINFWRDALDEHLVSLDVDKLSIEELLKMEWDCLACSIKKWCRAMKMIIRFYLASEKRLFDQVLGEFGTIVSTCFVEAVKASMLCLLNFSDAIVIGSHQPERLSCLLDMYEVVASLLRDVDALFSEEEGAFLRNEFHELLGKLGHSVKATLEEFQNQVASNISVTPFPKGAIHHLTKYVMNYITLLAAYGDTINLLFDDQDREALDPVVEEDRLSISPHAIHSVARCLWSLTSMLEANLEKKSNLYKDAALKQIFMMNNIHYMVQKVKDPEVRTYFGDVWIRKHIGKFQRHAISYQRATWSSVLCFLGDDGNTNVTILKERCRSFSISFEEVYKKQTGWFIPNSQLREDLRISTSQKVIHAYRTFHSRVTKSIGDKYIKYTADELEKYILDLFEGSPRSLHHQRRRFE